MPRTNSLQVKPYNPGLLTPSRAPMTPSGPGMNMMPITNNAGININRETSTKSDLDRHLNDSFNSYYDSLTQQQKNGFAPKDFGGGSLNGVPNEPDEDANIFDSIARQNVRAKFMKDINGAPTAAGLDLAGPIGPTQEGAALGAPGLPPISDEIRRGYKDKTQAYEDAKNYRLGGPANPTAWEVFKGHALADRQFEGDAAQRLIDKKVKEQQVAEKEKSANVLKDAQTKRALASADLAIKQSEIVGKPKPANEVDTGKLDLAKQGLEFKQQQELAKQSKIQLDADLRREGYDQRERDAILRATESYATTPLSVGRDGTRRFPTPADISNHAAALKSLRDGLKGGAGPATTPPPTTQPALGGGVLTGAAPATATQPSQQAPTNTLTPQPDGTYVHPSGAVYHKVTGGYQRIK